MQQVNWCLVRQVAQEVRTWVQRRAERTDYNTDDLNGWCAIASAQLHRALDAVGIRSEIHLHESNWECHVFIVVDDHVVDVTATQFKEFKHQPVVVLHCKEAEAYEYYESVKQFESAAELRKHQLSDHWPRSQVAYAR